MSSDVPSHPGLPWCAASQRNRVPILAALRPRLVRVGRLLEIGAGSGQHAVYLARAFPGLQWLPTDRREVLPGLQGRIDAEGPANLQPARALDVLLDPWPQGPFDAAYSANTAHIMPWPAVCATLAGLGRCLAPDAQFFLYGPFNVGGDYTAPSNRAFDVDLRARDPSMGLRDVDALETEAARHQLILEERVTMPANNLLLVFRIKQDGVP